MYALQDKPLYSTSDSVHFTFYRGIQVKSIPQRK